jgi:hypothetical protein
LAPGRVRHIDTRMGTVPSTLSAASRTSPERRPPKRIKVSNRAVMVALDRLRPAVVNDRVYKPVDRTDPSVVALSDDIREKRALLEPIVATQDDVIIAGHRRRIGCQLAGLTRVPVRRINILSTDPRFETYLVSFNDQRVKSPDEQIREQVIRTSPDDAHNALLAHRAVERAKAYRRIEDSGLRILTATPARRRSRITGAKAPMLKAATAILEQYRDYWPLTLRQVHYRMLTRYVLKHAARPDSLYINDELSYKNLSDLLTRARLAGLVPWESMHDPTRPQTRWIQWDGVGLYMREQADGFLAGYKRNLIQSQPAYVELVVEKIAAHDIAKRAASPYHVPVGVGKGYTSVTNLDETAQRFFASGKDQMIMLIAGDFDTDGENICKTWAACLRDEHGVENLTTVKVGVNPDQVAEFGLAPLPLKEGASKSAKTKAAKFAAEHGRQVYELEALEPDQLQDIIRSAIRDVLDMNLFAEEQRKESEEARHLMAYRKQFLDLVKGFNGTGLFE